MHVSGATTTVVASSGPQILHSITVNTAGTLCTVFDNSAASGAVIAAVATTTGGNVFVYDARMFKGITVVTTGAGTDLTITYGPPAA